MVLANESSGPLGRPVITEPELTLDSILELIAGRALAVVVPGWYREEWCEAIVGKLESKPWSTYDDPSARGIRTMGDALFNCVGSSMEDGCRYFDEAESNQRRLNELFLPFAHPMMRLKDALDVLYPGGCRSLRIDGRPGFFGLLRRLESGGQALPHTDNSDRDWPSAETISMQTQLFANTYLSKSQFGGTLQMWPREIPSAEEYNALREGTTYGLQRRLIGPPAVEIDPPRGALVIGRARCIHAVTEAWGEGARISSSSFIGVHRDPTGLSIFS